MNEKELKWWSMIELLFQWDKLIFYDPLLMRQLNECISYSFSWMYCLKRNDIILFTQVIHQSLMCHVSFYSDCDKWNSEFETFTLPEVQTNLQCFSFLVMREYLHESQRRRANLFRMKIVKVFRRHSLFNDSIISTIGRGNTVHIVV